MEDLTLFQKNHYQSLQKFLTNLIEIGFYFNCLLSLEGKEELILTYEMCKNDDENIEKSYFQHEIESFKSYLADRLTVFDLVKPHYDYINEQNEILLTKFFETFFLQLTEQKAKEKIHELYLSQFIPDSYEIINDQKILFFMNELSYQNNLEIQTTKARISFKTKMKEYSESIFNKLKMAMLENKNWAQYCEFKSYLDKK